jgi:hypothetical protein
VRFFTAAGPVNKLEEAQHAHQLERLLQQLDKADLLIVDELGRLSFSRTGATSLLVATSQRTRGWLRSLRGWLRFQEANVFPSRVMAKLIPGKRRSSLPVSASHNRTLPS